MDNLICGLNDVHFELLDLQLISQMIQILNISFEDQKPSHVNMIKALYFQYFVLGDKSKGSRVVTPANLIANYSSDESFLTNPIWKSLGFQSDKPQRDFRGGGLISLQNLIFFAHYHRFSIENIKSYCHLSDSFLFSCVVISALFWLKHFFHFDGDSLSLFKGIDAVRASRRGLKFFLSFADSEGSNNKYNGEEHKESWPDDGQFDSKGGQIDSEEREDVDQAEELSKILDNIFSNDQR